MGRLADASYITDVLLDLKRLNFHARKFLASQTTAAITVRMALVAQISARLTIVLPRRLDSFQIAHAPNMAVRFKYRKRRPQKQKFLKGHCHVGGNQGRNTVLTCRCIQPLKGIWHFAALALTENELSTVFDLCKISDLGRELAPV